MPAKDLYHDTVKNALIKDGWTITHEPYNLNNELFSRILMIDLGAERLIAAEKEDSSTGSLTKIAIEVKTFGGTSLIYEFHHALGQILNYQVGIEVQEPDRKLILAIPQETYQEMQTEKLYAASMLKYNVHILVYDIDNQSIVLWQK